MLRGWRGILYRELEKGVFGPLFGYNLVMLSKGRALSLGEILLVVSFMGLVVALVSTAVAGAQRSSRDAQRRNAMARMGAMIEQYASTNKGVYPTAEEATSADSAFGRQVEAAELFDPSGVRYEIWPDFNECDTHAVMTAHGPG